MTSVPMQARARSAAGPPGAGPADAQGGGSRTAERCADGAPGFGRRTPAEGGGDGGQGRAEDEGGRSGARPSASRERHGREVGSPRAGDRLHAGRRRRVDKLFASLSNSSPSRAHRLVRGAKARPLEGHFAHVPLFHVS